MAQRPVVLFDSGYRTDADWARRYTLGGAAARALMAGSGHIGKGMLIREWREFPEKRSVPDCR